EQIVTFQTLRYTRIGIVFCVALTLTHLVAACPTRAEESFQGRTISVIVGFSAGGAYDLYARVLSRHMGRHIPGSPKLVTQNMPGAGGLKAAGYLYDIAPKDGTAFGTFARGNVIGPMFGEGNFDATRFSWIGSVTDDVNVCLSWHTSAVKTWNDLL